MDQRFNHSGGTFRENESKFACSDLSRQVPFNSIQCRHMLSGAISALTIKLLYGRLEDTSLKQFK